MTWKPSHKHLRPYQVLQRVQNWSSNSNCLNWSLSLDEELEYEVEKILNSCMLHKMLQYLVQWKDYDNSHNDWEVVDNVKNYQ